MTGLDHPAMHHPQTGRPEHYCVLSMPKWMQIGTALPEWIRYNSMLVHLCSYFLLLAIYHWNEELAGRSVQFLMHSIRPIDRGKLAG